ncbi:glycoside hydrolase family 3 N-terminal domain-containing protein [Cellulomonas cellasea]|uniref:beta-xylosidase/alpha-l-arabinosidase n=1 Tax=Cellulomonas cellasea TaxID=43670 RepID=UPI0025A3DC21|nr:glycoside hydrolase family 3 N-terminal domain-containing protein [Cellulomonas cellasea]MDM8086031.1 glycoside hydrolase family 3 N-terminal domain-containing protein [Cellulomonas cellasea]
MAVDPDFLAHDATAPGPDGGIDPGPAPWRDPSRPVAERVEALLARMSLDEKLAQLVGLWVGADASGAVVAPHQNEMSDGALVWDEVIRDGLGQLTRPLGAAPVDPVAGARSLARSQAAIMSASRWRIPALVHEECLTGFTTWGATAYPVPLSWGAAFDPALVERMAARIGASMRAVGVHQGLAPVLDVSRDARWGRTEETIGEDPYLVGTLGAAYVRGLEGAGVIATLKHFAGYSASRAGRNLAPVSMGPRERADVILPPFEMALRDGGARSVMHSYADVDGVPAAADVGLLTTLLRDEWGFTGTVVADYFGIRFLQALHGVAQDEGEAAALALTAGVDVELPSVHCYGAPLRESVARGDVDESLVDRAARRVLAQKIGLGMLDDGWEPEPAGLDEVDLDDDENKALALRLAREAVVLLANPHATLPLRDLQRVAVVGPLADDPLAMMGDYTFPAHVAVHHPDVPPGVDAPTLLDALRGAGVDPLHAPGCAVTGDDTSGFAAAVRAAAAADVCVVAVGDRSGLFGRGTSGEGSDATGLRLPGVQEDLVRAVLGAGTPVVLVLVTGRPYAVGALSDDAAAVVQAFFPGQLGGQALAEVLLGAVNPSGRLPVGIPADPSGQPAPYLTAALGRRCDISSVDPTPRFPFGHGLSYTSFAWEGARVVGTADGQRARWDSAGSVQVEVLIRCSGDRAGTEVVQLYLHDPVAQVVQPVMRLVGYARVDLRPGEVARARFTVHADLASFTGLCGRRIVEPGDVELWLARSSADVHAVLPLSLEGPLREVGHDRVMTSSSAVALVEGAGGVVVS